MPGIEILLMQEQLETLETHVYSRETAPNTTRLEAILGKIIHGKVLTYSSGLSAIFAAYVSPLTSGFVFC